LAQARNQAAEQFDGESTFIARQQALNVERYIVLPILSVSLSNAGTVSK